jgi:hypothetical protein
VTVAVAMFVAVIVAQTAVADPGDPVSLLYCLPIALLAMAFGLRGGIVSGVAGVALMTSSLAADDVLTLLGVTTRALPMLLLGGLLGDAADRLRRAEADRHRTAVIASHAQDAAEVNDWVVQGLVAARWALESGDARLGLEAVTETLEASQRIVSDLLRGADLPPQTSGPLRQDARTRLEPDAPGTVDRGARGEPGP